VGSCNGAFRQLDAKTGRIQWETNVRGNAPKYFFHGDVFIAPDRIVASADVDLSTGAEAGLHAFDRSSGRQLWLHPAGRGVPGAVIGSGKRVFAYTSTGLLIALSLESGRREWSYDLKADGWESPAVVGQRVFAGSGDGSIFAFDIDTGRIAWQQKLGTAISTSIRADDSAVYAGTKDGTMHRLSAQNGEVLGSLKVDTTLKPGSAPLLRPDGALVLLTDAGADHRALVAMDLALERVRWRRQAPDRWSTTRVFATRKTVVLGTPAGEVMAYCVADGAPAWTHKLSSGPIRSIGGTDETLFVGTPQGTLYAIRPPNSCM
jgi:eukaryotic-like serine/threonine-protein kinase